MDPNQKPKPSPAPDLVLRAFYLHVGQSITVGGITGQPTSMTGWDREKHGAKLPVEERPNGDVWISHPNGTRIEVSVLAIAYKVRGPAKLEQQEAVRRGA